MLALVAVFLACFHDFCRYLIRGERATVMIVAADRKQSRVILRYIHGLLTGVPMLKRMIERETAEAFDLSNKITIEVATASFKTVRGYTICAGLLDELAFWPTDDASSIRMMRSSPPSAPAWQPSPTRCCCAPARPTAGKAHCGTHTANISRETTIRSSFGRLRRLP